MCRDMLFQIRNLRGNKHRNIVLVVFVLSFIVGCTPQPKAPINEEMPSPIAAKTTTIPTSTSTIVPTSTFTPAPTEIAWQWQQIADVDQMEKDTVSAIVSDPKNADILYVGMNNAGVYKSIDGGLTWSPAHMGLANTNINSMVIDPENTSRLLVGTDVGIFQTLDGGESWSFFIDGFKILMDPENPAHLYSLDMTSIHESTDGGNAWNTHRVESIDLWQLIADPVNFNTLYATDIFGQQGNAKGVYKSINNGKTWTFIGLEGKDVYSIAAAVDADGNTVLYAGGNRTFVSKDDGANWVEQSYGCNFLPSQPGITDTVFCYNYVGLVFLSPDKANKSFSGLWNKYIESVYINRDEQQMVAGGRGVYLSADDGKTWENHNDGIGATRMELKSDPFVTDRLFLANYMGQDEQDCALYRSDDAGISWKMIISGNHVSWCGPVFDDAGNLYMIHENKLYKSSSGGDSWSSYVLPLGIGYWISINPYVPGNIFLTSFDLYSSENYGSTWKQVSKLSGDPFTPFGKLYFAAGGETMYSIRGAFYSMDGGENWNGCQDPYPYQAPNSDTQLAIDPENGGRLYLATLGNGVHRSEDYCQSWVKLSMGIENQYINSIIIDQSDSSVLYAGTQDGVFVTFDAARHWHDISSGLIKEKVIYSLQMDSQGNVFATTPYGIYRLIK